MKRAFRRQKSVIAGNGVPGIPSKGFSAPSHMRRQLALRQKLGSLDQGSAICGALDGRCLIPKPAGG